MFKVTFQKPHLAIAPHQTIALYRIEDGMCYGGGLISFSGPSSLDVYS